MMMMTTTMMMMMMMMMALMNEPVHEVGEVPSRHRASVPVTHMAENNNNKNNPSQNHM